MANILERGQLRLEELAREALARDVPIDIFGVRPEEAERQRDRVEILQEEEEAERQAAAAEQKQRDVDPIEQKQLAEQKDIDPGDTFNAAVQQLQDNDVPIFQDKESGFTGEKIENFIKDNIDDEGDFTKIEELNKLVKTELTKAFSEQDSNKIIGIFALLGDVSRTLELEGINVSEIFEDAIEQSIPKEQIKSFQGRVQQPVNVPDLINNLFGVDLQQLESRSLGQEEILSIRREFQKDLDEIEERITLVTQEEIKEREVGRDPRDLPPVFGQNTLQKLQTYINDHVENDQLRLLLLNDIENRIAIDRDKIGVRLGSGPQRIVPISATEVKILREPLAEGIGTVLGESLVQLRQEEKDTLTVKGTIDKRKSSKRKLLDENTKELVEEFNNFIRRNQIKDPETGLLEIIPLKAQRIVSIPSEGLGPPERKEILEVIPTDELIRQLDVARVKFSRKQQIFSRVPIRQRDIATGQTRDLILQDLLQLQRKETTKDRKRKPMRHLRGTISKRAKFPNVEIKRGSRQPIKVSDEKLQQEHTAPQREIKIMRGITLAGLAKISNMIAMESGSLEDVRGQPLLTVIKGVTTIQEIVSVIMDLHKQHAGNDFSLIFVPHNVFGGQFLDGALAAIHTNRMLVNSLGHSSGASFRPADSVQHGGDLRDTFVQGEHQIEPHVFSSHGQNNIYHIQPFPFGGRIDNTGFIDKSQIVHDMFGILPKPIWADIPIHELTHFR